MVIDFTICCFIYQYVEEKKLKLENMNGIDFSVDVIAPLTRFSTEGWTCPPLADDAAEMIMLPKANGEIRRGAQAYAETNYSPFAEQRVICWYKG